MREIAEQPVVAGGVGFCPECGRFEDGEDGPIGAEVVGAVALGLFGLLVAVVIGWAWWRGLIQTALNDSTDPRLAYLGAGVLVMPIGHAVLTSVFDAADAVAAVVRRRR